MRAISRPLMVLVVILAQAGAATPAVAQDYELARSERVGGREKFGLGLDVGYPFSGVMLSYFASPRNAIQLEVGYMPAPWDVDLEPGAESGLGVRVAYEGYPAVLAEGRSYALPFFIGVGMGYTFNVQESVGFFDDTVARDSDLVSLFVPVGLQLRLRRVPVSFFAQVEPGVDLVVDPVDGLDEWTSNFTTRVGVGGAYHF